jgi:hypothetical protein
MNANGVAMQRLNAPPGWIGPSQYVVDCSLPHPAAGSPGYALALVLGPERR